MDDDVSFQSIPLADVWGSLWGSGARGDEGEPGIELKSDLEGDLLKVEKELVEQDCPGVCDGCTKKLDGPYFHCSLCPDFDTCFGCFEKEQCGHSKGHDFQLRHWPISRIPTDGSDLDHLQRLLSNDPHESSPIPYIATLDEQLGLLSGASRVKYLKKEVQRAKNWRKLYEIYSRFEQCASTLQAKISKDGIPVPPAVAPFQKTMEENWDTGNAKEAALSVHRSAFDREDYSREVDKKRLGNALLIFVREFMGGDGNEADDILHSGFASNELPPTPVDTMDEFDGTLVGSALTVQGTSQHQWEYLKPESELDLSQYMQNYHNKVVKVVSTFSERPDLWSPEGNFTLSMPEDSNFDKLHKAKLSRQLGQFEEALKLLALENGMDVDVAFERFRVFEDMGELLKCLECAESFEGMIETPKKDANSAKGFRFRLAAAYIACYVKGEWQNAMKLALLAYKNYLSDRTSCDITTVEIEIYYHKIWLAVSRDLGENMVYGESSARLTKLREAIQDAMLFPLAYEVLLVELELAKEPGRLPRVPSYWSAREFNDFLDVPVTACERIWSYLEKLSLSGLPLGGPVIEEAHCRLYLAEVFRRAAVTSPHIQPEMLFYQQSAFQRKEALRIYRECGSELGMANVALFDSRRSDQFDMKDELLSECDRICTLFEELESLRGQQETLLWKSEFLHKYFRDPVTKSYSDLERLAHKSGNMHQWHLSRMKKLQWWMTSTTLIDDCRLVFNGSQGFLSSKLGAIASLNLSRGYRAIGNLAYAEISGYFHMILVSCRDDNDHIYSALMNLLQIRNNLILELPAHIRSSTFAHWTQSWLQVLVNIIARGAELTAIGWRSRTYDIIKILELAFLLPRAGANFNTNLNLQEMELPPALHVNIPLLNLGLHLIEVLPLFFWPLFLDELGLTLAIVLESSGNYLLALRTCYQSLLSNHPGSKSLANRLKVRAGNLLMKIDILTPGRYKYAKAVAMKAFMEAEMFFWSDVTTDEGFKEAVWASTSLAACLLSMLMEELSGDGDDKTAGLHARFDVLVDACTSVTRRTIGQWQGIRRELLARSTSDTLRHQRTYLSGKLSDKLLSTHIELAVMLAQRGDGGGINLWRVVQQWKAISLSDLLWSSQSYIPDSSTLDAESRNLMDQEKTLVDKIEIAEPYERPDLRRKLRMHWMHMTSHSSFATFSAMKLGMGTTFDHLKQIQQISNKAGLENNAIIFVDWTRYRDNVILFAVRCSSKTQTLNYWKLPLTYPTIEDWVNRKMREKVPGSTGPLRRKQLGTVDDLLELSPLIDPLQQTIEGDELLVLCPSGVLNEIPLHAIHFRGSEDPLIATNPIVYSPSHAIIKSCVDSALRMVDSHRAGTKFAAFGRYGDLDATEDRLIKEMVVELAEQFDGVHTTGEDLKRDKFKNYTTGADFIHYHGHATCESDVSMRSLLLQPDPENEDDGRFVIDDIFQLQLESPHVTLLACASGEQDISFNDDPFGIVTAFFCAGATSVAGTMWPTDCRDARDFCDLFYDQLKDNSGPVMNMAKAMQKTVLTLREDWNFDDLYHWAQFVLYGSWFCRNVSK